ncbi:hypothetical protein CRM22_010994 [Opisthorchis felineus]|uniref:Tetraspanin n=2 Tax=Opisthorchis felineus TaxID=147828 RepID=A0A4S2KGF4_OPIFE|nr:hypothetical protein CRM22_010994 [Opisthorchis felineus]TGZ48046.1 hypothetical protein CRM22_010994 [Opisthorchis felineus]TGZ48047.1 hypothetical protein CRM22_010994 [Opisthorchis felineus]
MCDSLRSNVTGPLWTLMNKRERTKHHSFAQRKYLYGRCNLVNGRQPYPVENEVSLQATREPISIWTTMEETLVRRVSMLPYFHLCFIFTLLISASFGLSFNVLAISERFRDCPVLNLSFVVFWFHGAICCIQLCLGVFTIVLLAAVSCSCPCPRQRMQSPRAMSHLVTAVGSTGRFFVHQPACFSVSGKPYPSTPLGIGMPPEFEVTTVRGCCAHTLRSQRMGWLQPVAVITVMLLVAHLATLIWACSLYMDLHSPQSSFASLVTNLFVEAKVTPRDATPPQDKMYSLTVKECWHRIQTDLKCCGAIRFTDWVTNSSSQGVTVSLLDVLPPSCYCSSSSVDLCQAPYTVALSKGMVTNLGCISPLRTRIGERFFTIIITAPATFVLVLTAFLIDLTFTLRTAHLLLSQSETSSTIDGYD